MLKAVSQAATEKHTLRQCSWRVFALTLTPALTHSSAVGTPLCHSGRRAMEGENEVEGQGEGGGEGGCEGEGECGVRLGVGVEGNTSLCTCDVLVRL